MEPEEKNCAATLIRSIRETPNSKHLEFTLSNSDFLKTYRIPGQYILLSRGRHKPAFFALSNPPDKKTWGILVKKSSPLTAELFHLKKGDAFLSSPAQGQGFAMGKTLGKNVLLFAAGSGIAPIRAAVWAMVEKRTDYQKILLYYGARNPDEFAYRGEFPEWTRKKITLFQTISNTDAELWSGAKGYVQHLISEPFAAQNTVALVCGMKGMVEGVSEKLIFLGLSREMILTNY